MSRLGFIGVPEGGPFQVARQLKERLNKMPAKKQKPGRPPKMRDGRRINLYLPQAVIDGLEKLGEGNVSLGVQRAVAVAQEKSK